jgi:hypothetical protein
MYFGEGLRNKKEKEHANEFALFSFLAEIPK